MIINGLRFQESIGRVKYTRKYTSISLKELSLFLCNNLGLPPLQNTEWNRYLVPILLAFWFFVSWYVPVICTLSPLHLAWCRKTLFSVSIHLLVKWAVEPASAQISTNRFFYINILVISLAKSTPINNQFKSCIFVIELNAEIFSLKTDMQKSKHSAMKRL